MHARAMVVWMVVLATASDADEAKDAKRLDACREVIEELAGIKEGIPSDIFGKAACVAVIPGVKKAAIGIGGQFGFGAVACRKPDGRHSWGPPLMVELKGGSVGLQIGGEETDLVLLFMNLKGVDYLLRNKFTLGADVSVAAGPLGRSAGAATDVQMRAEILSYSRSRGLFAGISLEGASLKQDERANGVLYGDKVSPRDLLFKPGHEPPAAGLGFVAALERLSPRGPDK